MAAAEPVDVAEQFVRQCSARAAAQRAGGGTSAVQRLFRGTTVLVTGASGFLGKQLIEKLLRATDVSRVFVLLRDKRGKPIEQRLREMLQEPVYDLLREQQPNFADRVVAVAGDVAELRLGVSERDWALLTEQVNIMFHMAATTRFDERLRAATRVNVRGAREALLLGKACQNLKCYVHVSTAYSHARAELIDAEVREQFYRSPVQPAALVELVEALDEQTLDRMTPGLIKDWPNTYTFTKAVAEEVVRSFSQDLSLCVVRPAIVICAEREPAPGWIDVGNVFGASGFILGVGLGVMHAVLCRQDIKIGLVPVDYVNNVVLAAAWETHQRAVAGDTEPKIYTVTTSTRNPTTWEALRITMSRKRYSYPSPATVSYPFVWETANFHLFWIYSWLLHFIPAYIIDGGCWLIGKERRFVKLYTKMYKISLTLSYFVKNQWRLADGNTARLHAVLAPADARLFHFDVCQLHWGDYITLWCLGIRKYIIKDGLKQTAYAIKRIYVLQVFIYMIALVYFYLLYKLLSFAVLAVLFR